MKSNDIILNIFHSKLRKTIVFPSLNGNSLFVKARYDLIGEISDVTKMFNTFIILSLYYFSSRS